MNDYPKFKVQSLSFCLCPHCWPLIAVDCGWMSVRCARLSRTVRTGSQGIAIRPYTDTLVANRWLDPINSYQPSVVEMNSNLKLTIIYWLNDWKQPKIKWYRFCRAINSVLIGRLINECPHGSRAEVWTLEWSVDCECGHRSGLTVFDCLWFSSSKSLTVTQSQWVNGSHWEAVQSSVGPTVSRDRYLCLHSSDKTRDENQNEYSLAILMKDIEV